MRVRVGVRARVYVRPRPRAHKAAWRHVTWTWALFIVAACAAPHNARTQVGVTKFGEFEVEVVDPVADYLAQLKEVFDFALLKKFLSRKDFTMVFDAMHAVTGPYAKRILVEVGAWVGRRWWVCGWIGGVCGRGEAGWMEGLERGQGARAGSKGREQGQGEQVRTPESGCGAPHCRPSVSLWYTVKDGSGRRNRL